ncbi:AraC family transcriptional regulator [Chromatocurvus halotolerans]|uniref:AraC family transcriptional regulator n=1 Tax=Chromatocurvus halotolerans TaxID=1132028 RepID=A0A4R2L0J9_9GAMM|nr:AraC family transcriptional regulator [Chromatocurvus halotolerans]TCO76058.1 AraC family transcriptional regulator [Chromatocurvus halotolerans]
MQYDIRNPLLTAAATLRGSLEAARESNLDLQSSLARFGWSERWLWAPKGYIAYHTVVEFLNDVAARNGFSGFGFHVGRHQPPESYGPALQVLKLCATAREAVELAFRHHLLVSEVSLWTLAQDTHYATLERIERVQYPGDQRQLHELALTTVYALTRTIAGDHLPLREVHFVHGKPAHAKQMQGFFGCPVRFEQSANALIYPMQALDLPLPSADATILAAASSYLDTLSDVQALDDSLSHRIYVHIKQSLGTGDCNLEATAQRFGHSPRSLQRELRRRGYSFRDLVGKARLSAAEHYLKRTGIAASDLAGMLGYRNASGFSRAFKKHTGLAPDHWRRAHQSR